MLPAETGGTHVPQRLHGPDFVCFRCTQRDQSPRYSNNAVRTLPGMSRGKKKILFLCFSLGDWSGFFLLASALVCPLQSKLS